MGAAVWLLMVGRFPATMALRMLPALLPVIAADFDVSVVAVGSFLGLAQLAGLAAPVVASATSRFGAPRVLVISLFGFSMVAAGLAAAPTVWIFGSGLVALGIFAMGYEAASTAWVTYAAPFGSRSRLLGRIELSWSAGLLLGVPIAGVLAEVSWRLAYLVVAVVAASAAVRLQLGVSADWPEGQRRPGPARGGWAAAWRRGWRVFLAFASIGAAAQFVVVVFGVWLADSFGYSVSTIGSIAFLFGVGELMAVVATIRLTDRVGSARAATIGSALVVAAAVALAAGSEQVVVGVGAIVLLLGGHEFAHVSAKPLLADASPKSTGTGIGLGLATTSVFRALAAFGGTLAYEVGGLALAAGISGGLAAVAAWFFYLFRPAV